MDFKLQRALKQSQFLLEKANQNPKNLFEDPSLLKGKSVCHKLANIYYEELVKPGNDFEVSHSKKSCSTSKLLQKLVSQEQFNTLIVNLYPGNDGYSLILKNKGDSYIETVRLPYEESEVLEALDNEELPPSIVSLLEQSQANIFYDGCVIAEIRDYRRLASSNQYDSKYVLLRPSYQSLVFDINHLCADGRPWGQEDKVHLESKLLVQVSGPLCLDPTPAVALVASSLENEKSQFRSRNISRNVLKYSQAGINRKRKLLDGPTPKHFQLCDFFHSKPVKSRRMNNAGGALASAANEASKVDGAVNGNQPPARVDVSMVRQLAKPQRERNASGKNSDNSLNLVEEYLLESEKQPGKHVRTQLRILMRASDETYFGQLHFLRDNGVVSDAGSKLNAASSTTTTSGELEETGTRSSPFPLGSRSDVDRYLRQFMEIFTEEGRLSVKIVHQVPGKPPDISYTQGATPAGARSSQLLDLGIPASSLMTNRDKGTANASPSPAILIKPSGDALKQSNPALTKLPSLPTYAQAITGVKKSILPSATVSSPSGNKATDAEGTVLHPSISQAIHQKSAAMENNVGDQRLLKSPQLASAATTPTQATVNGSTGISISSLAQLQALGLLRSPNLQVSIGGISGGIAVPLSALQGGNTILNSQSFPFIITGNSGQSSTIGNSTNPAKDADSGNQSTPTTPTVTSASSLPDSVTFNARAGATLTHTTGSNQSNMLSVALSQLFAASQQQHQQQQLAKPASGGNLNLLPNIVSVNSLQGNKIGNSQQIVLNTGMATQAAVKSDSLTQGGNRMTPTLLSPLGAKSFLVSQRKPFPNSSAQPIFISSAPQPRLQTPVTVKPALPMMKPKKAKRTGSES